MTRIEISVRREGDRATISVGKDEAEVELEAIETLPAWRAVRKGPPPSEVPGQAAAVPDWRGEAFAIGNAFWKAAFENAVGQALLAGLSGPPAYETPKVVLDLEEDSRLHALPWEFLALPGSGPLVLSGVPLVRRIAGASIHPHPSPGPVRLAWVGIAPSDAEAGERLDLEGEARVVLEAMEALRDPRGVRIAPLGDRRAIEEALKHSRAHVLYLSGHGSAGSMQIEKEEDGTKEWIEGNDLAGILFKFPDLRLVVLSQCEGAMDPGTGFSIARALAGTVPWVAGFGSTILHEAAVSWAGALARSLREWPGCDPARHVAAARQALAPGAERIGTGAEWGLTVLFEADGADWPDLEGGETFLPKLPPAAVLASDGILAIDERGDRHIGRRRERRELARRFLSGGAKRIAIVGPAGTGKSALAAAFRNDLALRRKTPAYVIRCDKGPPEPAAIARAVEELADLPAGKGDPLRRIRHAASKPGEKPGLLILDDFEVCLDTEGKTEGEGLPIQNKDLHEAILAAGAGTLMVLVTSRYRVADVETLDLGPPPPDEARILLRHLFTGAEEEALGPEEAELLIDRTGGHPRALTTYHALRTGRCADAEVERDWERWGEKLVRTQDASKAREKAVDLIRDTDMRLPEVIESLSDGGKRLWKAASVLRRPVPQWGLARLGGEDLAGRLEDSLKDCLRWSLLHEEEFEGSAWKETRYRVPPIAVCAQSLGDRVLHGRAATVLRHLHGVERASPPDGEACLFHAVRGDDPRAVTAAGGRLLQFYERVGRPRRALRLASEALEVLAGREDVPAGVLAELEMVAGRIHSSLGRPAEARVLLERALHRFEGETAADEAKALAMVLHELANLESQLGRTDEARRLYERSLEMKERIGNVQGAAATLHGLAGLEARAGRTDEARRLYERSLEIDERIGDVQSAAATLHQLGILEADAGRTGEARRLYERSLKIEEQIGEVRGAARTLDQLAFLDADAGRTDEARRLYERSLEMMERIGDVQGAAATMHQLAIIETHAGRSDEARRLFERSLEMKVRIGDARGVAATLHQLAILDAQTGRTDQARRLYERSLEMEERSGNVQGAAATMLQLGQLDIAAGDAFKGLSRIATGWRGMRRFEQTSEGLAAKILAGSARGVAGAVRELLGRPGLPEAAAVHHRVLLALTAHLALELRSAGHESLVEGVGPDDPDALLGEAAAAASGDARMPVLFAQACRARARGEREAALALEGEALALSAGPLDGAGMLVSFSMGFGVFDIEWIDEQLREGGAGRAAAALFGAQRIADIKRKRAAARALAEGLAGEEPAGAVEILGRFLDPTDPVFQELYQKAVARVTGDPIPLGRIHLGAGRKDEARDALRPLTDNPPRGEEGTRVLDLWAKAQDEPGETHLALLRVLLRTSLTEERHRELTREVGEFWTSLAERKGGVDRLIEGIRSGEVTGSMAAAALWHLIDGGDLWKTGEAVPTWVEEWIRGAEPPAREVLADALARRGYVREDRAAADLAERAFRPEEREPSIHWKLVARTTER
ncbi:MAG: tetratricopeptide repeat protein [Planctomycetes bacterium]|nr:tetratricopeptide repeat protein [Planctomycetota bacterium]